MYLSFLITLIFLFLSFLPVKAENSYLSELAAFETSLNIQDNNISVIERLNKIENVLFGYSFQGNVSERIDNIRNKLYSNSNTAFVLKYPYVISAGDYYNSATNLRGMKWNHFPVGIYIGNVPIEYRNTAINAINKWKAYFPIEISTDIINSDINISFVNSFSTNENETTMGLAFNKGEKAYIEILKKSKYPPSGLEEIILHELGHSIGLGHSSNPDDIMYDKLKAEKGKITQWTITNIGYVPLIFPSGFKEAVQGKTIITHRDANTLLRTYSEPTKFQSNNIYNLNNLSSDKELLVTFEIQNKVEEYKDLATDYYFNGKYQLAIENYNKVLEIVPDDEASISNVGACYYKLNQYDTAINYFQKALLINPNDTIVLYSLGNSYVMKKMHIKAIEYFKKAVSITPSFDSAYANLGVVYLDIGKYDLAIANLNKAIEINPKNDIALINLGVVYTYKRLYKKASECFKKALSINPNSTVAKRNLKNIPKI